MIKHTAFQRNTSKFNRKFYFPVLLKIVTGLVPMLAALRAVQIIHRTLLKSVLHFPMAFIDITPTSRILQLFATDLNIVEIRVPWAIDGTVRTILEVNSKFSGMQSILLVYSCFCILIIANAAQLAPVLFIIIDTKLLTLQNLITVLLMMFLDLFPRMSGLLAAIAIHKYTLNRIFHVPMHFFETNLKGRILSR